jgi:hypothetical protein
MDLSLESTHECCHGALGDILHATKKSGRRLEKVPGGRSSHSDNEHDLLTALGNSRQ